MAKNTEEQDVQKVEKAAEVHIDEFLKGVEDANATLKHMFRHFMTKVKGIERKTVAEFEALFEEFKNLPASELK